MSRYRIQPTLEDAEWITNEYLRIDKLAREETDIYMTDILTGRAQQLDAWVTYFMCRRI
jgi:hypothetical protein